MAIAGNIRKIQLSNGSVYTIFDQGALRLDPTTKKIITGVGPVDEAILNGHLSITTIDDVPLAQVQYKVLVSPVIGTDASTGKPIYGQVQTQDIRQVLKNLGLITAQVEGTTLDLEVVDFEGSI
jgi:hypothetical protein